MYMFEILQPLQLITLQYVSSFLYNCNENKLSYINKMHHPPIKINYRKRFGEFGTFTVYIIYNKYYVKPLLTRKVCNDFYLSPINNKSYINQILSSGDSKNIFNLNHGKYIFIKKF